MVIPQSNRYEVLRRMEVRAHPVGQCVELWSNTQVATSCDDIPKPEVGRSVADHPVLGTPWHEATVDIAGEVGNGEGDLHIMEAKQAYD